MRKKRLESLGYLIHTNRELGLMLRGTKPLASFAMDIGREPDVVVRYLRMFDRHATAGRFVRQERTESGFGLGVRRVLYAQPGEVWRIDAMLRLYDETRKYTAEGESREGALLGYSKEEIEIWLNHLRRKGLI